MADQPFPKICKVTQRFEQPEIRDFASAVSEQIRGSQLASRVKAGANVAVAVGSRGIRNLREIVAATIAELQRMGFKPFVVNAMGTHGGATVEGQTELLADYGITQANVGAPIRVDMETVLLGENKFGAPVYWNRTAFQADAVVVVNRIKAHTDFTGPFESGVLKMLVIGLGNRESPVQVHRLGSQGMAKMVPASGEVILAQKKFALGLAIVENAADETAMLRAIEPENIFVDEPKLLQTSKEWMGRLPFDQADVVIVGEMGKNYSGAGMDPNVIGRRFVECEDDFPTPKITRLAVLDLSQESHGNAVGIGFADVTTSRLVRQIDHAILRLNTLTARLLQRSRIPFDFETDRDVLRICLETSWVPDWSQVRLALIPNTLELSDTYVTPTMLDSLRRNGRTLDIGPPMEIPFQQDRIDQVRLFPQALQGRRR